MHTSANREYRFEEGWWVGEAIALPDEVVEFWKRQVIWVDHRHRKRGMSMSECETCEGSGRDPEHPAFGESASEFFPCEDCNGTGSEACR